MHSALVLQLELPRVVKVAGLMCVVTGIHFLLAGTSHSREVLEDQDLPVDGSVTQLLWL